MVGGHVIPVSPVHDLRHLQVVQGGGGGEEVVLGQVALERVVLGVVGRVRVVEQLQRLRGEEVIFILMKRTND